MPAKAVVLGGNFGGLVTALSLKRELGDEVDVTVVSPSERFVFTPSLIWVPFGRRSLEQISFPVAPTFEAHGVTFVPEAATHVDPVGKTCTTDGGRVLGYDYLVVATGFRNDFTAVPGLGPAGNASTITTVSDAFDAAASWTRFLRSPGDIVIGAAPGAGCFGAAYEFLFNTAYHLRRLKLDRRVRLTYVTAEPFVGHFGIGGLPGGEALLGMFLRRQGIEVVPEAAITEVEQGAVALGDGRRVPFSWAMVIPAFRGQQVVEDTTGLADQRGFVPVRETYQSEKYDDIYAVGVAAAVSVPWKSVVPLGVPKTGFPTEQQAHVAAKNIAAQVRGELPTHARRFGDIPAVCVMDAGNNGVLILADKMLPPRKGGVLVPGPQSHLMKLGFEKYFLWKSRHGYVGLP